MEVKIDGNPGTGNTFQEIKIGYVENYVPNATTVINNHYGESGKAKPQTDRETSKADLLVRRGEIMQYVGNLRPYVSEKWKNRYEAVWHAILDLPAVAAVIYEPGKQKDTSFNRNLVANIIYIMCGRRILIESNATKLTEALEGDKDHSVRAQLGKAPDNKVICEKVNKLIGDE